jgi:mono/diheme cytochrome c family protein
MKHPVLVALLTAASALGLLAPLPARAANTDAGKYQAVLGDCAGCHGRDLSGGVTLETPFGTLVTPNITLDRATGIGGWTAAEFRTAMKTGVAPGGKRLYPAMPYPAYAHMRDADVGELWAWLRTVRPVRKAVDVNHLRFPFNLRFVMAGWNLLFFHPPQAVAASRGRYLVDGAAHCGTCHSPKNIFGADKAPALSGGVLAGWYAPNLTGEPVTGLASWSKANLVEYLKTGRNAHGIASGPMAEAVENSMSRMTDSDLGAIAAYIKALPASGGNGGGVGQGNAQVAAGAGVYRLGCSACHGADGRGSAVFPPLAGNPNVRQPSAETLARVVLAGTHGAATKSAPTGQGMPSFAWKLDDAAIANVLTYIRNSWGNAAPPVDAGLVARMRTGG